MLDFLFQLMLMLKEEDAWQVWLSKDIDLTFEEYKKKIFSPETQKSNKGTLTKVEEQKAVEKAEKILGRR